MPHSRPSQRQASENVALSRLTSLDLRGFCCRRSAHEDYAGGGHLCLTQSAESRQVRTPEDLLHATRNVEGAEANLGAAIIAILTFH